MPEHHGRKSLSTSKTEMKASYLDYAMSVIVGRLCRTFATG